MKEIKNYFEGVCDGLELATQEIDKFIGADSDEVTFDDLINATVQAYKDGKIKSMSVCDDKIGFTSEEDITWFDIGDEKKGIGYIKSLYTETFVINDLETLRKVDVDANGTLANGSKFNVIRGCGKYLGKDKLYIEFKNGTTNHASLEVLKGATVTQKRGE